uniref:THAP-type domain-containing protein n=1 Tax=Amphimedon queenslandica TaxID=400682 RepID=A0A1X7T6W7_AMPQE
MEDTYKPLELRIDGAVKRNANGIGGHFGWQDGVFCCAFGCTNRQGKIGIKFYRFPSHPGRRSKWIAAIKRQNWTPSEYSRLCSADFILEFSDYRRAIEESTTSKLCSQGILRSRNKSLNANAKRYKRDSLRNGQDEEVTEESTLLESEQLQQEVEDEAPAYEDKEPTDEEEPMFDEEPVYNDNKQTDNDKGEDQNMKIKIQQTNKKNQRNQSMKTKNWRN